VELQGRVSELERRGLGLAVITYDPVDSLARFASVKGITYALLSDEGSAVIEEYGIRNTGVEPGSRADGIPYPGTFVLDRAGQVVSRHFEPAYQIRHTASSLVVRGGTPLDSAADRGVRIEAPNLDLTVYASDETVAPGHRFSLVLDITPRELIHVYAPPQESYQAISLELEPVPGLERHPMTFPPSEEYHFVPLDERVQVYMRPFRLIQDVHFAVSDQLSAMSEHDSRPVTIRGTLSYQACDDRLCYPPEDVPVAWSVEIKGLESGVP